jgi:hypothetical protein
MDPVAHVNHSCVGCGLCGEVAHAAILCPSFYRAEIVQNPNAWDRLIARLRAGIIGWPQPAWGEFGTIAALSSRRLRMVAGKFMNW